MFGCFSDIYLNKYFKMPYCVHVKSTLKDCVCVCVCGVCVCVVVCSGVWWCVEACGGGVVGCGGGVPLWRWCSGVWRCVVVCVCMRKRVYVCV